MLLCSACVRPYKKLVYSFGVLLLLCVSLPAGAQKLDSLRAALAEHAFDDTTRVNLLATVAGAYMETSWDSAVNIAGRGITLARRIGYKKGEIECLTCQGEAYYSGHDYIKARQCLTDALEMNKKAGNATGTARCLQKLGSLCVRENKTRLAEEYEKESIMLYEHIGDKAGAAKGALILGTLCFDMARYPAAVEHYLNALKLYEHTGDSARMRETYTDMATVYAYMNDTGNTNRYIDLALAIRHRESRVENVLDNIVNIGISYGMTGQDNKATAILLTGYHIADSVHNHYWKNIVIANLAQSYFNLHKYDSSLLCYDYLLHDSASIKDPTVRIMGYMGKGNILIQQNKVREGIPLMTLAFNYYRDAGLKDPAYQVAHTLADAYDTIKNYEKALEFHKIFRAYHDSLYSDSNAKSIQQLQFDYQLEKKQDQIHLLQKNKQIQLEKSARRQVLLVTLIVGIALFLIIIILLVRSWLAEKRSKELFFRQKEEIQEQAHKLEDLNGFKDKTFSVLSHDLRGPLATFTATMSMLDEELLSPKEFSDLKPEVNRQLNSLNVLLENLLQWSENHMKGDAGVKTEKIDLSAIVAANIDLASAGAARKKITLVNLVPANCYAMADEGQVNVVVRNLTGNAVKFTNEGGTITVSAHEDAGMIYLSVADTGIGMTAAQLEKLFRATPGNNTYGTHGEKGIGLGLLLCSEFIKANNGTLSVTSQPGKGTTFTFSLPVPGNAGQITTASAT